MKKLIFRWETALLAMLVAELVIFGIVNPRFLNVANLIYGTSDFVQIGIVDAGNFKGVTELGHLRSHVEDELAKAGFSEIRTDDTSLDYQFIITARP